MDETDWEIFSENPNLVPLLEKNPRKIKLSYLCKNPNAMHLLEKYSYLQYFNWNNLSENPGIFEIDYMKTKKNMVDIFFEELMMVALHPNRIMKWLEEGFKDF